MKKMFCFQCQETAQNKGCEIKGVCGKSADVANMQDLLIYVTKGLASILLEMRKENINVDPSYNHRVTYNLFTTITNANFDKNVLLNVVKDTIKLNATLRNELNSTENLIEAALYEEFSEDTLEEKAKAVGVLSTEDEDIRSLRELTIYGLKGLAAYSKHANALLEEEEEIDIFIQTALVKTTDNSLTLDELVQLVLETGSYGVKGMALLDKANTSAYGNPELTEVNIGTKNNPAILISGHDLRDMEMLLEQTEDTGVDVYTHSEMLPANYYPKFKKYSHFVGNYGSSWHHQKSEFDSFNGPILMTTNCIVPPSPSYLDRLYTTGTAGWPGAKHISGEIGEYKDFTEIIEQAKKCRPPKEIEKGSIIGGFAHNQVFQLADKVVEAVTNGDIKKFVVMAGCDGRQKTRSYYTEFAQQLPKDTVILTAGCAKYRYNKLNLGDIHGIPRVLDAGQCNDSYSLVMIALKLQEIFGLDDVNDLPIIYNIAWYEQKAVIVLLALLSLGVKNIHLGPTLPAFLSPNVAKVLVEKFGIASIQSVEEDMELFFPEINASVHNSTIITKDMLISDILALKAEKATVLQEMGMHCLGCPSSQMETLSEAAMVHGADVDKILKKINQ